MLHYIIAAFGFAVLCYMIATADDRQERAGMIGASRAADALDFTTTRSGVGLSELLCRITGE